MIARCAPLCAGLPLTGVQAYYTPENLTKTLKITWPTQRRPYEYAQNEMAGIHVRLKIISRRKIISRLLACGLTTTLHYMYFHYDSCANLVNHVYPLLVVNHSIISIHSCILTGLLPHSADLRHQAWRTNMPNINTPGVPYAQKYTPWRTYAQFKKLNGSAACT